MNFIEIIVSGFVGAVIGYFFNELVSIIRIRIKKAGVAKTNQNLLKNLSSQDYSTTKNGIVQLAHGVPAYDREELKRKITNRRFFYPIPKEDGLADKLKKHDFVQNDYEDFKYTREVNCLSASFWGIPEFNKAFSCFGPLKWDDETKLEFKAVAKDVAQQFINDLDDGLVRFNGALFGVSSFHPGRSLGNELPIAEINFYKTDYFTYRVFAQYYLNHRDDFQKFKVDSAIINKIAYPFLSSFGISTIAVVSSNDVNADLDETDVLIVGCRSKKVVVDKGKLHFTMNEAFSLRDTLYSDPSFDLCVSRGFKEELKWSKDVEGLSFSECKFMDFIYDSNKCEMGLTSFLKISLSENMSVERLRDLYNESQDGILETEGLDFIALKDARHYLEENKTKMTPGFATALENFLRRYEMSLL